MDVLLQVSVSVSVSVSWGWQGRAESEKGLSSPVPDQQRSSSCFSCVFRWFPSSTSLICLLEPWRRQASAFASLASPEQSRRLRVGLPSRVKPQRISRGVLLTCSFPSKVSSHLRAVSHHLNRISKLAHRRSQPLHWISCRMVWFSTSLLGATRSRLQRMPWVSTSQPGTMRHHSQGTTSTLTSSLKLN